MIKCKYGHFSDDGREYIITNPYTPRPWINVISNGDYSLIVSQMGGGFSFRNNAEQNRLTRLFQDIVKDNWGKYFYIRDRQTGHYFSATLKPIMTPCDRYEVHHGQGYSTFLRETDGIRSEMTVFVSHDSPMEYLHFRLTNLGKKDRDLDVTGYFEWAPGIAYDCHREFQKLFSTLSFDPKLNSILVTKCLWGFPDSQGIYNNDDWPYTGFFACSQKVSSFDTDKEAFLGMYHDETTAQAMVSKELKGTQGRFGDPVGAMRTHLPLKAGETKELVFTIGMASNENENYHKLIQKTTLAACAKDLQSVKNFWTDLLTKETVETPDKEFDVFTNIWSKYQALSCRMWAKAAYYQISGGIGFRDQLQDSLCFLESEPELTKKQILLHAAHQFQKGDVYHWWLPIHTWGPRGNCSDDFLWLPYAVISYVNETQDFAILDEVIPFVDGSQATLYDHCVRALKHSFEMVSSRGVQLMGDNDWNDGLSAVGHGMKGESFWVNEFLYYILNHFDVLLNYENDDKTRGLVNEKKKQARDTFNAYGWDGSYFLQATTDAGKLVGSHTTQEGKVFLNPQVWAVISDITDEEHKTKAMASVTRYLLKDYGALLLYPAYTHPHPDIGYVTRYAPGLRENGGVYTHAATWAVLAYAQMGDNERAYQAYQRICPPHRSKDIDVLKSEPYVTPGNSDGPISPFYGKGGWSWYSGSAQWMHNVAVHGILGVEGVPEGLRIKPCLPKAWDGYHYHRVYAGKDVTITVKRTGLAKMTVNGKAVSGNIIPFNKKISHYDVVVEIA